MNFCSVRELRSGSKVVFNSEPCVVIRNVSTKLGRGRAFNKLSLRGLFSGKFSEKIFKSAAFVEVADFLNTRVEYLYSDAADSHFVDRCDLRFFRIGNLLIKNDLEWLVQGTVYTLVSWNDRPAAVILPTSVVLRVRECAPYARGDTVGCGSKFAVLANGVKVKVPPFVEVGESVRVDTRDGRYLSRV